MNLLGIFLLIASGGSGLLAISVVKDTPDPGIGTFIGAFAIPALLGWWGVNSLSGEKRGNAKVEDPSPETHVRCPECRELVRSDAKLCKHCHTKLIPSNVSQ